MQIKTMIIGGVILILGFILTDAIGGETKTYEGTVLDKHYTASTRTHGTGVGVTSSGDLAVVSTTSGSPEKFTAIVKGQKETLSIRTSIETYYQLEKGIGVEYKIRYGMVTNLPYNKCITKIKTDDY